MVGPEVVSAICAEDRNKGPFISKLTFIWGFAATVWAVPSHAVPRFQASQAEAAAVALDAVVPTHTVWSIEGWRK
jgi:hypothetical protein